MNPEKTLERILPGPTGRALLSALLALALLAFMFQYIFAGAYLQAFMYAFFALVNADLGRVQWRKRNEVVA